MFHESSLSPAAVIVRRPRKSMCSWRTQYKLDDVAQFISRGAAQSSDVGEPFRRVALQFPDDLLGDAVAVVETLKGLLTSDTGDTRLFVLADNTFGSCCPDEITAQHYNSDCIVHFGEACMSRSTRVPVFYVQEAWEFAAFKGHREQLALSARAVVRAVSVLLDTLRERQVKEGIHARVILTVVGSHQSRSVVETASQEWKCLANEEGNEKDKERTEEEDIWGVRVEWCIFEAHLASLTDSKNFSNAASNGNTIDSSLHVSSLSSSSWVVNGVRFSRVNPGESVVQYFLYVGPSSASIPLHLLGVHHYNIFHLTESLREKAFESGGLAVLTILDESFSAENSANLTLDDSVLRVALEAHMEANMNVLIPAKMTLLNRRMRQRAFNIELIRSSTAVGILVASLAIDGYYETTMLLHKILRLYGKRSYIIYIGHLNEYKIANFVDTVDCFVAVACPNCREGHFPEKSDGFSKPIVSPAEVVLALAAQDEYSPLFGQPFAYSTAFESVLPPLREAVRAAEEARAEKPTAAISVPQDGGAGAALIRASSTALTAHSGAAGALARLHERAFVGLDPCVGQTPVQTEVMPGRHGIARGYETEREQQQQQQQQQQQKQQKHE